MHITADTRIADIAAANPATIKVFQQHEIDFCCGGRIPLADACARHGIDADSLLAELREARPLEEAPAQLEAATLTSLIAHIQRRYHEPLRAELPRLAAMMAKVVERHGDRLRETLPPLQRTFERLRLELLAHMDKEDAVLFPAIVASEAALGQTETQQAPWQWIEEPIHVMEAEHASAGTALATMRRLTSGYVTPEGACPTFIGLYHGLAQFENDMHVHVHLENNVLFPRASLLGRVLAIRADRGRSFEVDRA
jgi:regulator of cell morphogenesis and NO signaling